MYICTNSSNLLAMLPKFKNHFLIIYGKNGITALSYSDCNNNSIVTNKNHILLYSVNMKISQKNILQLPYLFFLSTFIKTPAGDLEMVSPFGKVFP